MFCSYNFGLKKFAQSLIWLCASEWQVQEDLTMSHGLYWQLNYMTYCRIHVHFYSVFTLI